MAVPTMAALVAARPLLHDARTDLESTSAEAYGLLAVYAVFAGWLLLETVEATNQIS